MHECHDVVFRIKVFYTDNSYARNLQSKNHDIFMLSKKMKPAKRCTNGM